MPSLARHVILIVVATALGTVVYCLALKWIWGEDITGELAAVVFAAATSLCIVYPLIYLPAFRMLARKLSGTRPYFLFPLLGMVQRRSGPFCFGPFCFSSFFLAPSVFGSLILGPDSATGLAYLVVCL